VVGSCEHGNETSDSIQDRKLLDKLGECNLKVSAGWSYSAGMACCSSGSECVRQEENKPGVQTSFC